MFSLIGFVALSMSKVQSTLIRTAPSENGSLCGRASLVVMVRSRVVQLRNVVNEYSILWSTK